MVPATMNFAPQSRIEILETRIAPATISIVNGVAIYTAAAGESNDIDFSIESGSTYRLSDGPTITLGAGTAGLVFDGGPGVVTFSIDAVSGVQFLLGDENDSLNVQGLADPLTVVGGTGADSFTTDNSSFQNPSLEANGAVSIDSESITFSNCPLLATSVILKADTLQLDKAIFADSLTLLTSAGRPFDLGSEDPSRVSLTAAEVFNLQGSSSISIGDTTSGAIQSTAAVDFGTSAVTLNAGTGTLITQSGSGAITAGALGIHASAMVTMIGANNVGTLAADVGGSNSFSFNDTTGFQIGTVNGLAGILGGNVNLSAAQFVVQAAGANVVSSSLHLTGAGSFSLTNPGNDTTNLSAVITGELSYTDVNAVDVGAGFGLQTSNANITLGVSNLSISGGINAGTGVVTIAPPTVLTSINLGGADAANVLGLTQVELNFITASALQILGGGAMLVTTSINVTSLNALALAGTSITGAGSLRVPLLAIGTGGAFTVTGASDVDTLAFSASPTSGAISFADADGFSLCAPGLFNLDTFDLGGTSLTTFDVGSADVAFPDQTTVKFTFFGVDPGFEYDQFAITGTVSIASTTLEVEITNLLPAGTEFVIIDNDGTDAVVGTFDGLDEGDAIPGFFPPATITYVGGDGNDVAIITVDPLASTPAANGKSITFRDVDGDIVTITASKGTFTGNEISGVETGGPNGAGQLQKLTLDDDFSGANITITAKPSADGGNGFMNLGFLDATGVDLGTVSIAGDLARLKAGTPGGDPKVPALKGLTIESLGLLGLSTVAAPDQLDPGIVVRGSLPKLTVKGDVRTTIAAIDGSLGTVSIGGSVVATSADVFIYAATGITSLKIAGDIRNADLRNLTISTDGPLGALGVGGSIAGANDTYPVTITALGQLLAPEQGTNLAIKSLTVLGSVERAQIAAGRSYGDAGPQNADASIGSITVGGDWIASSARAGTIAGDDLVIGSFDDANFFAPGTIDKPDVHSSIGSFTVKGQALGTFGSTTDMFGVVAEQIGKAKVGGRTFAFKAPKTGAPNLEAFFAAPTLDGAGAENPKFDFAIREVGAATPDGLVNAGVDLKISDDGTTATFNDVDGDEVTVKRTVGAFTADGSDFYITTAASGGGQLELLNVVGPADTKPIGLTITAKPGADGGNGFVNVGAIYFQSPLGDHLPIGAVSVAGDVGFFLGGKSVGGKPGVAALTVHSFGALGTSTGAAYLFPQFDDGIGKLTVATDIRGALIQTHPLGSFPARLGALTVGGSLTSDALIYGDAGLGAVKIAGSIRQATISAGLGAIDSLTIGGDLIGDGVNVTIAAFGQLTSPGKGIDLAIKSLTVKGSVENARIIAGQDSYYHSDRNADAAIGAVSVGRMWLASSLVAGAQSGFGGYFGTGADTKIQGTPTRDDNDATPIFSQIVSIVIKGQALGSLAAGDTFGIVAEQIGSAKIGSVKFKFDKGERDAADHFALAPTGPGATGLASDFFIREITM